MSDYKLLLAEAKLWDRCYPGNVNIERLVVRMTAAIERLTRELSEATDRAERAEAALRGAESALKPFADRVSYDNGDVGVSNTHAVTSEQFIAAFFAWDRARAAITQYRDAP
jgi:hypothetical protein